MGKAGRHVIVLGPDASLRVRQGALAIEHGEGSERVKMRLDIDDPMPCAILFDGRGEFLTGDAILWCARRGVTIVLPDGPGRLATIIHSALEATMEGGASGASALRDVGPAIIRAQCAADPVRVAREIVRAKIAADMKGLGPRVMPRDRSTIARCEAKLTEARSVAEIVMIEARAGGVYWRSWRDLGLIERKGGNLPASWKRFAQRNKGPEFLGNRHAAHPVNACLNYVIVVEAGRLARILTAKGMALQVGFLHSDKHGRNSLVWDCVEPLRARINTSVFRFIGGREFSRADFPASGVKVYRIARPVIAELLRKCLLPDREIIDAAEWLAALVLRYGASARRANGSARGAGNPVSPPYGEGFRDGAHGKSHRYEKGKRKRALSDLPTAPRGEAAQLRDRLRLRPRPPRPSSAPSRLRARNDTRPREKPASDDPEGAESQSYGRVPELAEGLSKRGGRREGDAARGSVRAIQVAARQGICARPAMICFIARTCPHACGRVRRLRRAHHNGRRSLEKTVY